MKKLLCLFLSLLLVLSFAGCTTEEYDDALALNNLQEGDDLEEFEDKDGYDYLQDFEYIEADDDTQTTVAGNASNYGYRDAVRLMMKVFDNSYTKEELRAMYPEECWTWFEEEKGLSFDEIHESYSKKTAEDWEAAKEHVGEGATLRYEYLERTIYEGEAFETSKADIIAKYGIDSEAFGICYELKYIRSTVGTQREDVLDQLCHVVEIHDRWYVIEVLLYMPII